MAVRRCVMVVLACPGARAALVAPLLLITIQLIQILRRNLFLNWGHAITGADTPVGIELVREMCKRGAERVIMACDDVEVGQDVAVEIRGETNGDIIVEHCDMSW